MDRDKIAGEDYPMISSETAEGKHDLCFPLPWSTFVKYLPFPCCWPKITALASKLA